MNTFRFALPLPLAAVLVLPAAPAFAQDLPPPSPAVAATVTETAPARDRGAFVIGVKVGGLFSEAFSKLGPSFLVEVETGYVLPRLKRSFAILIDAGYTQPTASGDPGSMGSAVPADPRVAANGGAYHWDLTQRELTFGLTIMYRLTLIRDWVAPYVGIGPRLWLLETTVSGNAGANNPISESTEQSTKVGLSVPIGVDFKLGPGRIFGEMQILWAPIDHRITGEASVGSITVGAGYRLFL
jgi:opacity protein-like surface antigen